mmetsp:Transcript_118965/g.331901  ORF Transcript_118965/g.331901 Transcript_118965/m.331901 type:complete len:246 (+) Transcript_118965:33-770(+)
MQRPLPTEALLEPGCRLRLRPWLARRSCRRGWRAGPRRTGALLPSRTRAAASGRSWMTCASGYSSCLALSQPWPSSTSWRWPSCRTLSAMRAWRPLQQGRRWHSPCSRAWGMIAASSWRLSNTRTQAKCTSSCCMEQIQIWHWGSSGAPASSLPAAHPWPRRHSCRARPWCTCLRRLVRTLTRDTRSRPVRSRRPGTAPPSMHASPPATCSCCRTSCCTGRTCMQLAPMGLTCCGRQRTSAKPRS